MKDLLNHLNFTDSDFQNYKNKVLLILSDDDKTFNDSVKKSLVSIMPNPVVVTNILGGHLALMIRFEEYKNVIVNFLENNNDA